MLTDKVKQDMAKMRIFAVSTASKAGEPNVIAVGMLKIIDDETVWMVDNFMGKTLSNLRDNPRVSFLVWSPDTEGAWQVKGDVTVVNEGDDFKKAREWAHSVRETLPAKNLLVMKVTDIYNVKSGADAGKKVA